MTILKSLARAHSRGTYVTWFTSPRSSKILNRWLVITLAVRKTWSLSRYLPLVHIKHFKIKGQTNRKTLNYTWSFYKKTSHTALVVYRIPPSCWRDTTWKLVSLRKIRGKVFFRTKPFKLWCKFLYLLLSIFFLILLIKFKLIRIPGTKNHW